MKSIIFAAASALLVLSANAFANDASCQLLTTATCYRLPAKFSVAAYVADLHVYETEVDSYQQTYAYNITQSTPIFYVQVNTVYNSCANASLTQTVNQSFDPSGVSVGSYIPKQSADQLKALTVSEINYKLADILNYQCK